MDTSRIRRLLFVLSSFLGLMTFVPSAGSVSGRIKIPPLKKIEIIDTNNYFSGFSSDLYPENSADKAYLSNLRAYVLKRVRLDPQDDPGVILKALEWVSLQWKQDGMNEPRKGESALDILKDVHQRGARYRCVEYSLVLSEILRSLGYVSRKLSLRSVNVAYGPGGQGHVGTEVWSNHLQKWIFVDPQFSVYPTYKGRYLNYYEIYRLKKQGKFSKIRFNATPGYQKRDPKFNAQDYVRGYRQFLKQYFGYMATPITRSGKNYDLVLQLDGKREPLTFQGLPLGNSLFTRDPRDLYFKVNQTLINFQYRRDAGSYQKLLKEKGLVITGKTDAEKIAEVKKLEPLFADKPNFILSFLNNSPWHSYYEYRLSARGSWLKISGDSMNWNLKSGRSYLEVRSVNQMEIPGPGTFVDVLYQ